MQVNINTHIIVTGANGFIGSSIVQYFSQLNCRVTALVRKIPDQKINGVEYVTFDLKNRTRLNCITENSVLIHTAYIKEKQNDKEDYNITGTKHLLNQATESGVKQCVFLSSISVLSNSESYYSKQKIEIEKLFDKNLDLVLRLGLVIGNGGLFQNSINTLRKTKVLPLINGGTQPIYFVYVKDVLKYLEFALLKNETGLKHLFANNSVSYKVFYEFVSAHNQIKIKTINVPLFAMKFSVWMFSFLKNPPITKDNLLGLVSTQNIQVKPETTFTFLDLETILSATKLD
jgi:nucleoside-diphosphate-sugar epimerase